MIYTIATINVFKDGTFIASKNNGMKKFDNIKGKFSNEALDYLEEIYKNPPGDK